MKYWSIFFIGLLLIGCTVRESTNTETTIVRDDDQKGKVIVTLTDDVVSLGAVSGIKVTIDSVDLYSDELGWVTVMGDEDTFDLLQLKASGQHAVLGDAVLDAGTYTRARLDISSVQVADSRGSHDADLPSEKYEVMADLIIEDAGTSTLTFDFLADQSLHVTTDGDYVFAPVVRVETRTDAVVEPVGERRVVITGGNVVENVVYGMDLEGIVAVNVIVPDTEIVVRNGVISTTTTNRTVVTTRTTTTRTDPPRNDSNTTRTNVTVNMTA